MVPVFRATFSPGARLLSHEGTEKNELKMNGTMYGAVVCSWGLHATLVADSDTREFRKFGDERFAMVANNLLNPADQSGPHSYQGVLTVGSSADDEGHDVQRMERKYMTIGFPADEVQRKEHGYILATFCSKLDANFTVSPHSKPLDGCLRIVHFGPENAQEIWRLFGNGKGLLVEDEAITYREIESFGITFKEEDERWRRVCVDGHIISVEKDGKVFVRKERGDILQLRVMATE